MSLDTVQQGTVCVRNHISVAREGEDRGGRMCSLRGFVRKPALRMQICCMGEKGAKNRSQERKRDDGACRPTQLWSGTSKMRSCEGDQGGATPKERGIGGTGERGEEENEGRGEGRSRDHRFYCGWQRGLEKLATKREGVERGKLGWAGLIV